MLPDEVAMKGTQPGCRGAITPRLNDPRIGEQRSSQRALQETRHVQCAASHGVVYMLNQKTDMYIYSGDWIAQRMVQVLGRWKSCI